MKNICVLFSIIVVLFVFKGCNSNKIEGDIEEGLIQQSAESPNLVSNSENSINTELVKFILMSEYEIIDTSNPINLKLENNSEHDIHTGYEYHVEKSVGNNWEKLPLEIISIDPEIIINSNEAFDFDILLYPEQYDYEPGLYRISKTVQIEQSDFSISVDFNIS